MTRDGPVRANGLRLGCESVPQFLGLLPFSPERTHLEGGLAAEGKEGKGWCCLSLSIQLVRTKGSPSTPVRWMDTCAP